MRTTWLQSDWARRENCLDWAVRLSRDEIKIAVCDAALGLGSGADSTERL
jgi:hypothetical protein